MDTSHDKGAEAVEPRGRVLLVDDDPAVRTSLRRALESEDYAVTVAADGGQAMEEMARGFIDVVLLDLNLPGLSGWDVFERLTAIHPFLPIIIITARPDQYRLAAAAGVSAIMEKPLSLPLLIESIDGLVHESLENRVHRILSNKPLMLAQSA